MHSDTYTPGYSAPVLSFMGQRTAEIHGGFFAATGARLARARRGLRPRRDHLGVGAEACSNTSATPRQAGFAVQKMSASYEVITETLLAIGASLAGQFAVPGYCSLNKDKSGEEALFVALAWCEATGRAE